MQADARREEMERLEQDLTLFSRAIAYPPTPPLAAALRRRLEATRREARPAHTWQLALAGAAAAVVLAAALLGSVTPAREAVADFFDKINIFQTESIPRGLPTEIPGSPSTLEEAGARVGFSIQLPAYPKELQPERVLLQEFETEFGPTRAAVLFFTHPNGTPFLVLETNAYVGKGIPADGVVMAEAIDGFGGEAYWIAGAHTVQYYDEHGDVIPASVRLTGENTLIWAQGEFVFRLEGNLSQEEAVLIAKSLR